MGAPREGECATCADVRRLALFWGRPGTPSRDWLVRVSRWCNGKPLLTQEYASRRILKALDGGR